MRPRRVAILLVTALAACSEEEAPPTPAVATSAEALAALDGMKPGWRQLEVNDKSRFDELAHVEKGFKGPYQDATGRYIEVLETERGAARLEEFGFKVRTAVTESGPGTQNALAVNCGVVPTPATSAYLWPIKDIHNELQAMHNGSTIVTKQFGTSHTGANPLLAVRFGPTNTKIRTPPTLYIVATHHAREWISTGVVMEITRTLRNAILTPASDPTLSAALQTNAIVVVPVVNPDGYEFTRTNDRSWRGNRDTAACSTGVDINRNYTTSWKEPAASITTFCSPTFCGPGAASEKETQAMEALLRGDAFGVGTQVPAAAISYHSYGDIVVYADGYKKATDAEGPRCAFEYAKSGCTNPDFQLLRRLYGDTHSPFQAAPLMVDTTVSPAAPFARDHGRTDLYSVSGEFNLQAQYVASGRRLVSVVPELPNAPFDFFIECQPNFDSIIKEAALLQLNVIRRIAPELTALVSSDPNVGYAPKQLGRYASGIMTREYSEKRLPDDARATFVKPIWRPVSTGSLTATINGNTVNYQRGRTAAQYEAFFLDQDTPKWDPLCLPCQITSTIPQDKGDKDTAVDCTTCVKLCDGGRLPASGWKLDAGNRGPAGKPDCWWSPTASNGTLTFPTSAPPANAKACHFSFAMQWTGSTAGWRVTVERQNAGGTWEWLWENPYASPRFSTSITDRLVSLAFEGNDQLPGKVGAFRLRLSGSGALPADLKVFDPVVYCKTGTIP